MVTIPGVGAGVPTPAWNACQQGGSLWVESPLFVGATLLAYPYPQPHALLSPVLADQGMAFAACGGQEQVVDGSPAVVTKGPSPSGQLFETRGVLGVAPALLAGEASLGHPVAQGKPFLDVALGDLRV